MGLKFDTLDVAILEIILLSKFVTSFWQGHF
jgi:hypothetical protein